MEKLETALTDFKNFEYIYGESINKQQAFIDAVDGLKKLNNPSLVGQFIEYFMAADRLTQQYIFDAILL